MANKKSSSGKNSQKKLPKDIIYIAIIVVLVIALLVVVFAGNKLSLFTGVLPDNDKTADDGNANNSNPPSGNTGNNRDFYTSILSGEANIVLPSEFDGNNCLEVHFINVNQGDAIAIMLPDGKKMLIDAGNGSGAKPSAAVRTSYFSYLSDNLGLAAGDTIDYLVVTHPDADHVNMMSEVLTTYDVDNIYYNDATNASSVTATYETFMNNAEKENGANLYPVGKKIMTETISGADYTVDLYAPGYETFREEAIESADPNKNILSIMCVLSYGGRKIMFTGDAEMPTESWFMQTVGGTILDVDVLKVGHHGSYSCTSTDFLDFIQPEYAVISCGVGNKYHHPSPETMNTLFNYGIITYRTDRQGSIVLYVADDGDFGFLPENNVAVENNSKYGNPRTIKLKNA